MAVVTGLALLWGWQAVQVHQRLTHELTMTRGALTSARDENITLQPRLTHVQADLERIQTQQDALTAKLSEARQQAAEAQQAREHVISQLQFLQAEQQRWTTEKLWLEQHLSALQQEKMALEQRVSALETSRKAQTSSMSPEHSAMPPTAGSATNAGNHGYLKRVLVLPADAAASSSTAPRD